MKGIIYCAHNLISNKKYIGCTQQSLDMRIYQHIIRSKVKKYKFYNAAKKYGWDSFIFGIIEQYEIEYLYEREKYWIQYYDTYINGYNLTSGGEFGIVPSVCVNYSFISPDGISHTGNNVRKFARDNNLCHSSLIKVSKGKMQQHKGWRLVGNEKKNIYVISPDDKIYKVENQSNFCKTHKLSNSGLSQLINEKLLHYRGWKLTKYEYA